MTSCHGTLAAHLAAIAAISIRSHSPPSSAALMLMVAVTLCLLFDRKDHYERTWSSGSAHGFPVFAVEMFHSLFKLVFIPSSFLFSLLPAL